MDRVLLGLGIVLTLLTFVGWYLLSGFGCEMNTSGCRTVRLDWSRDALRLVLPPLCVGVCLIMFGIRKRVRRRGRDV